MIALISACVCAQIIARVSGQAVGGAHAAAIVPANDILPAVNAID
ncbi:exported hypothetical protein [Mesorhizobium sp. SOD10]|nr:exported hypothetical protein [Mesorhizobium sp. SOD10]